MTTFDELRNIIVRDFEVSPERLTRTTRLEDVELDSLAVMELVFTLEDEFHVTAENTAPAFSTLGDLADYIDRLIAARGPAPPARVARPAARAKSPRAPKTTRASKAKQPPRATAAAKPTRSPKRRRSNGARSRGPAP